MNNLDILGVEKSLTLFPDQIRNAWKEAGAFELPVISPKALIVSGMGGSSNAAKILQGIFESEIQIPFIVHNDYGLPAWVNAEDLVVVNSYSGNTEETLSAVEAAKRVGARVVAVTTGGKLKGMIQSKEIDGVYVGDTDNPSHLPKVGLGISLGALSGTLAKMKILSIKEDDLNRDLDELSEVRNGWDAKEMATWLNGFMPVLFGARPFTGSLNAGRNAMCEISRNFTQFYDFPEVNHVLIEALDKPVLSRDLKYLFFESDFLNDRVKLRFEETKKILTEQGLNFKSYFLKCSTKFGQGLELPHYTAWMAFHLSMLQNTDPGPEPWIFKLKASLSQTLH